MGEKCPCETYVTSCCACVSMHCDECHGHNKFVQGRFCSNCGRPLKAELTRLYVPKSEVEHWREEAENQSVLWRQHFESIYETAKETFKAEVAREIFEEIEEGCIVKYGNTLLFNQDNFDELKKEYTED